MSDTPVLVYAQIGLLGLMVSALPLSWWWLRQRDADVRARLAALTALTLFLTFDLIVFGSFTRLTDSGLGCPDWPGCYGAVSPVGAHAEIKAAEAAMPTGPVTAQKAWIEMVHRYLAMSVGVLILISAVAAWRLQARLPHSPWWATATLAWVIVQGLFGKYTVTWKLYPAIVTLHLLGGMVLLALLAAQHESFKHRPLRAAVSRTAVFVTLAVLMAQVTLGGWVSTNYAVLACNGFPSCNGQWWPSMDFGHAFTVRRELGQTGAGEWLPFDALVAIHWTHRVFAVVATLALAWLAARLWREPDRSARAYAWLLAGVLLVQWLTGLSNVVLGWPLLAALAHTAGAAAISGLLVSLALRLNPRETP